MKEKSLEALPIDCTRLCCNFVNTVHSWKDADTYDFFNTYEDFIDWCGKVQSGEKQWLENLRGNARKRPVLASRTLQHVRKTRGLFHQLLTAIASNQRAEYTRIAGILNPLINEAQRHSYLEFGRNKVTVTYEQKQSDLNGPLWPVIGSLNSLLLNDNLKRIKECPSCGWIFYDTTKNGKRRWCNPATCGTKDKMDRYRKNKDEQ